MSKNLYIATCEPGSGKSLVVLGVMELLSRRVDRLGFFRPIIRSDEKRDNDTELIISRYCLSQDPDDTYGMTYDQARSISSESSANDFLKRILERYRAIESENDFVLCEGTDFAGVTSAFEFDFNAHIANHLGAPVLNVVTGRGKNPANILDAALAARRAFVDEGCTVVASAVNRVATDEIGTVRSLFDERWRFEDPVQLIADEPMLDAPSVGEVAVALNAVSLNTGHLDLNRDVARFSVAAMQLPNFLDRVQEGTLVITPGDRADILLGCLATIASVNYPQLAGVLLTGGLEPHASVVRLVEGFRRPLLPILSVETDTYQTVQDVMAVEGSIGPQNERKIQAALGLFESSVDLPVLEARIDVVRSRVVTPLMFEYDLIEQAKRDRQRVVLPEGQEERILRAAEILRRRDVVDITLLGEPEKIHDSITSMGLFLEDVEIIDPLESAYLERFAERFVELRKHKGATEAIALDLMHDVSYFGTMMVYEGLADGMVSGAVHTTAHTIRPALQFIRTKPGCSTVSSVFLMCLKDRVLVYGDCAVNPNPTPEQLADIAISSAETALMFGIEPRVAMLSYSTGQSGSGTDVDQVKQATQLVKQLRPDLMVEGPIQYDAAIDVSVARTKLPDSEVGGRATVFIFPDLNTGNNTYKAVQRSAGAVAIGPVLQGLRKPVNDLSRGCTVTDIVNTVAITAIQAQRVKD